MSVSLTLSEIHAASIVRATEATEALTTRELASMSDCGRPDELNAKGEATEGANALRTARDLAAEACADHLAELDPAEAVELCNDAWELAQAVNDSLWEGIDGSATLIYTARYREAFADLDGWEEDPEGDMGPLGSIDQAAQMAVFQIMRRCGLAVAERYAEAYIEAVEELGGLPTEKSAD